MVVNAAQLATYSQAKEAILATKYVQDGEIFLISGIWFSLKKYFKILDFNNFYFD